jgi:hypothetical protein
VGRQAARLVAALFAASLAAPARLAAQESGVFGLIHLGIGITSVARLLESDVTVRPGDEIRVRRWHGPDTRGTLDRAGGDSLVLHVGDSAVAIPRSDVRRVQRYEGLERKTAQGFGYGLLIGAGTGAFIGLASGSDPPGNEFSFTAQEKAVILGIVGGLSGSFIGGIAGTFRVGEHWRGADARPATLTFLPGRNGTSVGVRLTF